MVRIESWGAAGEVTGSKHLLDTGRNRILVECGLFQGRREEARRKNESFGFDPRSLTACLATHGHLDHCGLYPRLVREGYEGNIVSTPATRDVAGLVMLDAAKIQAQDADYLGRRQRKDPQPWRTVYEPLYDARDARRALERFVTVSYGRPFAIAPGVEVTLHDAGHILGSATARFTIRREAGGELAVGFSGDLGRKNTPILRDPAPMPPVDWLVCESTYGDRLHEPACDGEERLGTIVRETAERGGRLIIPAFAVGRTQELVYLLHGLHRDGKIPELPVFVDSPMAVSATAIYRAHPECFDEETIEDFLDQGESPFAFDRLHYVRRVEESKRINDLRGPCIIISSSGMAEAGRVLHHLAHGIGDPRNTVLFAGFQAGSTLGRRLVDGADEVRIFGEPHAVRARVLSLDCFSAHADYAEIGAWVRQLDLVRLKGVLLVHGEPGAQAHLAEFLRQAGVRRVEALAQGRPVVLD
jgi:metallo-beta-lactamase family protein